MNVRPLRDRIIVKRIEDEQTSGSIIIPDSAKEKPLQGTIISVGSGKVNNKGEVKKLDVKKGDTIVFGKYSGTEIKINGEDVIILKEDDVLGVIE